MSVVMVPTTVSKCVTTHMEHTNASAMMVMSLEVMASRAQVQKLKFIWYKGHPYFPPPLINVVGIKVIPSFMQYRRQWLTV